MKNCLKGLSVIALSLLVSISGVNAATASVSINKNACEKVYTNYYFFLEAETSDYMTTNNPATMRHSSIATYKNHYYSTNFDSNNVGYGQMEVSRSSYDSSDDITSMSLASFYNKALRASNEATGSFSTGDKNYFFIHDWYKFVAGMPKNGGDSLDISRIHADLLINATMDADTEMVRIDSVKYQNNSTFSVEVTRSNFRNFGNTPVRIGNYTWYLHPAVYYVQYCAPKANNNYFTLDYVGNGVNVSNVPARQSFLAGQTTTVSPMIPVKPGYRFVGWGVTPNQTVASYFPGNVINATTVLYAIWTKDTQNTYSIVYNPNTTDTVSNMPESITKNIGEVATISPVTPARNGYTFLGWSSTSGATTIESKYNAGSNYTDSKDIVLYAVWKKNDVTTTTTTTTKRAELPENPKTGVEDYILPFGGVALASLAGIIKLKKKNSFLQF